MTWIDCPACGKFRSATGMSSDGECVSPCSHCGDPGWTNPFPLTDDPTVGRPK